MNNTDKDETVVTRCPTPRCNREIMGQNSGGDLVCTVCGRIITTIEPVEELEDEKMLE